jgi:uncharacterized protein YciI
MHFLMHCRHRDGVDALRDATRPAHREHVASGGNGLVRVLIGSALATEDRARRGNFGILEAASREDVLTFAQQDPFNLVGIVESIEITAIADGFPAHRIAPSG